MSPRKASPTEKGWHDDVAYHAGTGHALASLVQEGRAAWGHRFARIDPQDLPVIVKLADELTRMDAQLALAAVGGGSPDPGESTLNATLLALRTEAVSLRKHVDAVIGKVRENPNYAAIAKVLRFMQAASRMVIARVDYAQPAPIRVPLAGRMLYHLFPFRRRVILDNMRRVFGATLDEDTVLDLAQAHYWHLWRLAGEFLRFRWLSRERKLALVRIENLDAFVDAYHQGKGVLLLTGHFGNWEVATVAGIGSFPQMRGRFHFVRRALKPDWFDRLIVRRFQAAGFGVMAKQGSLDAMLERLVLRCPEQWYWVHRRWKEVKPDARRRKMRTADAARGNA